MSVPFSNTHYRIPQGFGNLLEGLTREILREQPDNIPAFAAAYFENLLEKREKTNFDPAEWGSKLEDRFYNNRIQALENVFVEAVTLLSKNQEQPEKCEQEMARSSGREETPVTPFEESTEEEKEKEEQAALKIQSAFRGHVAREEVKKMKSDKTGQEKREGQE